MLCFNVILYCLSSNKFCLPLQIVLAFITSSSRGLQHVHKHWTRLKTITVWKFTRALANSNFKISVI